MLSDWSKIGNGENAMTAIHNFRQTEFREKVTGAILEMLADLPETQRITFILNHYRGYQPKQIADLLRCSPSEIEAALDAINSILSQRTHSLRAEDTTLDAEAELSANSLREIEVTPQPLLEPVAAATGVLQDCTKSLEWLVEALENRRLLRKDLGQDGGDGTRVSRDRKRSRLGASG
jgi:hypothetical protein